MKPDTTHNKSLQSETTGAPGTQSDTQLDTNGEEPVTNYSRETSANAPVEKVLEEAMPGESVATVIALDEIVRTGKDELNLIEHPFAAMWDKENQNTVIFHEWDARHPESGKTIRASWRVAGDPELGLPKPNDERVYLVLMELTREAHFQSQILYFTRYDLVKRLGWPLNDKSYRMLYDAFERLKAVNIVAKNAFWEPRAKSFRNVGFSIIDNFDILNEKPGRKSQKSEQAELPMSYFRWNDVIFQSFRTGYMRTLDLALALSLKGDISLRLYRYLDKKSYDGRRHFEIDLESLCERHLGMRAARYPSKHKERLKPAHDELIERGVLDSVAYQPMKSKKGEKVCYSFPSKSPVRGALPAGQDKDTQSSELRDIAEAAGQPQSDTQPTVKIAQTTAAGGNTPSNNRGKSNARAAITNASEEPVSDLMQRMLDLRISPDVASELLKTVSAEHLMLQLDCLQDRAPKDAAAVFVKAVRGRWEAPPRYFERQEATERAEQVKRDHEAAGARKAAQQAKEREEQAVAEQDAAKLDKVWESLDERTRERIEKEAIERLGILGQMGRAQAALGAMRRSLLREMLGQLLNDSQ